MAVAFPSDAAVPSQGSRLKKDYRVRGVNFGDGYSQRSADGLNVEIEEWSLLWENITAAEAQVLVDFFDARYGVEAITYTMPKDSVSKKWVVKSYNRVPESDAYDRVEAVFERVYDL